MNGSIVENSAFGFHVIDLFSCEEVRNVYKNGGSWAQGGSYSEIQIRKPGDKEFTTFLIDSKEWDRYSTCMKNKISPEEYNTYLKVKKS